MTHSRTRVLGRIMLVAVLVSALPLGSNRPIWWLLLSVVVAAIFLAQIILDWRQGIGRSARLALVPLSLIVLVLFWAFIQVSVPVDLDIAHPVWALTGLEAGRLSADPIEGFHHILRGVAYCMVFWVALRAARNSGFADEALKIIAVSITALCAFGIIAAIKGQNPLLGELGTRSVSGSFVNRNNFATFAAIGLLANLAVYTRIRPEASPDRVRQLRNFLEMFFSTGWLFVTGILICLVAILFSESRAGLGAALLGIAIFALTGRQQGARTSYAALFVAALIAFAVLAFSSGTFQRVFTTAGEEARFLIYPLVIDGIWDRPWLGHGLGAFQDAFRPYVSVELARLEIDLAHSSYLENIFELGLPAAFLFYAALALIFAMLVLGLRRRRRNRHFVRFAVAVSLAAGFHAFFDFSLQIPAVAALFAFVLGLGWAQAFPAQDRSSR